MLALRAVARHGFIRAARKQHLSNASAPARLRRSNRPSAAEAFCAIAPSVRPAPTRAGRYATHNGSLTAQGFARSSRSTATASSPSATERRRRAGRLRGSASACSASARPSGAAKRACYCAPWRGWPRAVRSYGNSRTGRSRPSSIAGAPASTTSLECAGRLPRLCWDRSGISYGRKSRWIIAPLSRNGRTLVILERSEFWTDSRLQWIAGASGRRKH